MTPVASADKLKLGRAHGGAAYGIEGRDFPALTLWEN